MWWASRVCQFCNWSGKAALGNLWVRPANHALLGSAGRWLQLACRLVCWLIIHHLERTPPLPRESFFVLPALVRTWVREHQCTWALSVPSTELYCLVLRGTHCSSNLFKESAAASGVCFRSLFCFPVQHNPPFKHCVYMIRKFILFCRITSFYL